MHASLLLLPLIWTATVVADEPKDAKPLPPAEAAKLVGQTCTVELTVKASKNALAKRQKVYLDSEENFKDDANFAVILTQAAADKLKEQGIDDPAVHYKGKTVRVTGEVSRDEEHGYPRIVLDDPTKIQIVQKD
jgi:hypothetical protein